MLSILSIVTLGSRGCLVVAGGSAERIPAVPVRGDLDTTGAGDAFAGGLLVAHAMCASWEDALAAGHAAARRHLLAQREAQR